MSCMRNHSHGVIKGMRLLERIVLLYSSLSSFSIMLHATVLLCLVFGVVITHSLAAVVPVDDSILVNNAIHDDSINDTLSIETGLPTCLADYSRMSIANRRIFQDRNPTPSAICVRSDGYFVAAVPSTNSPNVIFFDPCGWFRGRIVVPAVYGNGFGCAFSQSYLFYSTSNSILQYSSDGGVLQNVFANGEPFMHMVTQGNFLYATIGGKNLIRVYDFVNRKYIRTLQTKSRYAQGLAFDIRGLLHVTTLSSIVEVMTTTGYPYMGTMDFKEVVQGDGIAMDRNGNTIIADRGSRQVFIYDQQKLFVRPPITGFQLPVDVTFNSGCSLLMVADMGRGIYML